MYPKNTCLGRVMGEVRVVWFNPIMLISPEAREKWFSCPARTKILECVREDGGRSRTRVVTDVYNGEEVLVVWQACQDETEPHRCWWSADGEKFSWGSTDLKRGEIFATIRVSGGAFVVKAPTFDVEADLLATQPISS
jgi:hypothetical protein